MRTRILIAIAALFMACGATSFDPNAPRAIDAAATLDMLDSIYSTYNDRFLDSTTALADRHYTADACILAPDQPRFCGIDSIVIFNWSNGNNVGLDVRMHPEEVMGTSAEITEVGNFEIFMSGGELRSSGKYMAVHRWIDGRWKVHREIWNSDAPR